MKLLIPALCLCVVPALAAPACATGTYASYQALSGGCSIGNALFSNFSALSFVNSPGVGTLTPGEIEVIPSGSLSDDVLTFMYLNAAGSPTPVTLNQNGQVFSLGLSYDIVVTPGSLTGIEMSSTFGNTAPGSASASKTAQPVGGGSAITSTVNDGGISNSQGTYSGAVMPVTGAGTFLITDTTSLQAQTGSATQSGFANSFLVSPGATATPEIGSLTMIGSGLVFLSMIASSTRRRKRGKD
ncbi:MAG TPA: hypothetical protein VNU44_04425 [Bryobacteraceae bacterium]|jgi:hypothetical protein|nr:hypothetical protein [Bryobacteraceae bacterium]